MINHTRGSHPIKHSTLIQDHAEGGARAVDVETFIRAIYAHQAHLIVCLPLHTYRSIALHWIERSYGHLQQGLRLLMSNCDFLQMQKPDVCPAPFWQHALPALGMMPGLTPMTPQNLKPVDLTGISALEREAARGQKVAIRQDWTLLEFLGEPLLYNVNMNGDWGASLLDTAATFLAARDKNRSEAQHSYESPLNAGISANGITTSP